MVFSGEKREASEEEMERLKPLHNFDLPCLKWGNQKVLRCMKVDRKQPSEKMDRRFRSSADRKFSSSEKMKTIAGDDEIEATREKLMFDFQTEVGKMKDAILRGSFVDPPPAPTPATTSCSPAERPWNLRTRRAGGKDPSFSDVVAGNGDHLKPNVSPSSGEKRDRLKFCVSLSRREVEEDFTAMTGRRLPRKPKKRSRIVQKQLDTLFPGLWLSEITTDLYRVPDDSDTGKR
ncbi:hypothetical protein R6Q57_014855 [Mikania cordata]